MTIREMALRLRVATCTGGCGLSKTRHREGCIFMDVVHFGERRFSRRSAKNYLMLVARLRREADPEYLNHELFDWWYCYHDSVETGRLAMTLGFRIPAHLFDPERRLCHLLGTQRGVKWSRYPRVRQWVAG